MNPITLRGQRHDALTFALRQGREPRKKVKGAAYEQQADLRRRQKVEQLRPNTTQTAAGDDRTASFGRVKERPADSNTGSRSLSVSAAEHSKVDEPEESCLGPKRTSPFRQLEPNVAAKGDSIEHGQTVEPRD